VYSSLQKKMEKSAHPQAARIIPVICHQISVRRPSKKNLAIFGI